MIKPTEKCAQTRHFVDKLFKLKSTVYATLNLGILENNLKELKYKRCVLRGDTLMYRMIEYRI